MVLSEIGSNGQPNYLTYDSSVGITLRTTNRSTTFTAASGPKNYTLEYYKDVLAWPKALLTGVTQAWLFIDVNKTSSVRTYGITTLAPMFGNTAPTNPANGQHWFDVPRSLMKVYNSASHSWVTVIRVFAGHFTSPSTVTTQQFGSQVNITGVSAVTGAIFVDGFGVAVKDSQGNFITTEDTLTVSGAPSHATKLESNVMVAEAAEPMAAFSAVKFDIHGQLLLANYADTGHSAIGITTADADANEPVNIVLQGQVRNPGWNWSGPNVTLWIGTTGHLVIDDPYPSNGATERQPPVARSINSTTIIFSPGLVNIIGDRGPMGFKGDQGNQGDKGDKGDMGPPGSTPDASTTVKGIAKLSVAPTSATNPIAVGINDPILTAPRTPTQHNHGADEVDVDGFGDFGPGNVQDALEYLDTVQKISYKKLVLPDAASITAAFNALSDGDRTLTPNALAVLEWANTIYMWTGGVGFPAVATSDAQFIVIGKMTTPLSIKIAKAYTAYTVGE